MLSPFWFWPSDRKQIPRLALRAIAGVVVASSLAAGVAALARDLRTAYLWAGRSIFGEADRRQMDAVRSALADGEVLLVYAVADDVWSARLWQRGLYPRNPVVVQLSASPEGPGGLRKRYGARRAVLIGSPAFAPKLRGDRDLGPRIGRPGRVRFGELP